MIRLRSQMLYSLSFVFAQRLGSPIEGCMLFEDTNFLSLGIRDATTASVSWEDPEGEEPTQRITFTSDRTYYPDDYVTCFPVPPTVEPTMSPTEAPRERFPLLGVIGIAAGINAGLIGAMVLLGIMDGGDEGCSSKDTSADGLFGGLFDGGDCSSASKSGSRESADEDMFGFFEDESPPPKSDKEHKGKGGSRRLSGRGGGEERLRRRSKVKGQRKAKDQ